MEIGRASRQPAQGWALELADVRAFPGHHGAPDVGRLRDLPGGVANYRDPYASIGFSPAAVPSNVISNCPPRPTACLCRTRSTIKPRITRAVRRTARPPTLPPPHRRPFRPQQSAMPPYDPGFGPRSQCLWAAKRVALLSPSRFLSPCRPRRTSTFFTLPPILL
jgi:hypothetical protein